ncbi:MAG: ribonuclease H-like domain-containing protein [SAR324 cluster bacterium]|nr:ribonuclease H-like domain-containing protein [SAR324 cluster bacterium]MBF0352466.1 ribonuclease H-like domain-containing protein [SAR324 cluster bacterium]
MKRILYFDLESKYSADEVGGWNNIMDMGMSVGIVWDSLDSQFHVYLDNQVQDLIDHFKKVELIVGFNHIGFDYRVVAGARHANQQERNQLYAELMALPNLDMLTEISKILGHRLKLDAIARPTLGTGKSADGLQALQWYKEGKLDKIIEYCKIDVEVTRDVYQYALKHQELLYDSRSGVKSVKVEWNKETPKKEVQQMSLF